MSAYHVSKLSHWSLLLAAHYCIRQERRERAIMAGWPPHIGIRASRWIETARECLDAAKLREPLKLP